MLYNFYYEKFISDNPKSGRHSLLETYDLLVNFSRKASVPFLKKYVNEITSKK